MILAQYTVCHLSTVHTDIFMVTISVTYKSYEFHKRSVYIHKLLNLLPLKLGHHVGEPIVPSDSLSLVCCVLVNKSKWRVLFQHEQILDQIKLEVTKHAVFIEGHVSWRVRWILTPYLNYAIDCHSVFDISASQTVSTLHCKNNDKKCQ